MRTPLAPSRGAPARSSAPKFHLLVVLATILAGCFGDAPNRLHAEGDTQAVRLIAHPTGVLPMEQGAGEPAIVALGGGVLVAMAPVGGQYRPDALGPGAYIWRSADDGATWSVINRPSNDTLDQPRVPGVVRVCSCDSDLVATRSGELYATDWTPGPQGGVFHVYRSGDQGRSWKETTLPLATPTAWFWPTMTDRQWLAATDAGTVCLVYRGDEVSSFDGALWSTCSADRGAIWNPPIRIGPSSSGPNFAAHPIVTEAGLIVVPYAVMGQEGFRSGGRGPAEIWITVSSDGGATWRSSMVARNMEGFGNLWPLQGAQTGRTTLLAWTVESDRAISLVATRSTDLQTWSKPETITAEGLSVKPWVTARAGVFAVSWYGSDFQGSMENVEQTTPWFIRAALSHEDSTSWLAGDADPVPVKRGPVARGGGSKDRELLDFSGIALDENGVAHVAYARAANVYGLKAVVLHSRVLGGTD